MVKILDTLCSIVGVIACFVMSVQTASGAVKPDANIESFLWLFIAVSIGLRLLK